MVNGSLVLVIAGSVLGVGAKDRAALGAVNSEKLVKFIAKIAERVGSWSQYARRAAAQAG